MIRPVITAHAGRSNGQHRTQPFAAGINQVPGKFGDQVDVGSRLIKDDPVDVAHIVADQLKKLIKTWLWLTCVRELNDYTQKLVPRIASVCVQYILPRWMVVNPVATNWQSVFGAATSHGAACYSVFSGGLLS